jgi:hypothetical protein
MQPIDLRSEVEINAPAEHVLRVLTDFDRYHEWNPFIPTIAGKALLGEELALELSLPEGKTYRLRPRVTHLSATELRWRGSYVFPFLLEAEHYFLLNERGAQLTRFAQGQKLSGFLLRFAGNSLNLSLRGFAHMNQALKKRAEAGLQTR